MDFFKGFVNVLKTNQTLESISLETNKITGKFLKILSQALESNATLKEMRIANQVFYVYNLYSDHGVVR